VILVKYRVFNKMNIARQSEALKTIQHRAETISSLLNSLDRDEYDREDLKNSYVFIVNILSQLSTDTINKNFLTDLCSRIFAGETERIVASFNTTQEDENVNVSNRNGKNVERKDVEDVKNTKSDVQIEKKDKETVKSDVQIEKKNTESVKKNTESVKSDVQIEKKDKESVKKNTESVKSDVQIEKKDKESVKKNTETVQTAKKTLKKNTETVKSNVKSNELSDVKKRKAASGGKVVNSKKAKICNECFLTTAQITMIKGDIENDIMCVRIDLSEDVQFESESWKNVYYRNFRMGKEIADSQNGSNGLVELYFDDQQQKLILNCKFEKKGLEYNYCVSLLEYDVIDRMSLSKETKNALVVLLEAIKSVGVVREISQDECIFGVSNRIIQVNSSE